MSKKFKQLWKDFAYAHPLIDLETLDFNINDLTMRMMKALTFDEWRNLFHEREGVQVQRNTTAQTI